MKTKLYIFVVSAMLIATCGAAGAAESEKSGQTGKKKAQVILVAKKERDRSGESGKTEAIHPKSHSRH